MDCQSYILIAVVSTVSFTVDTENWGGGRHEYLVEAWIRVSRDTSLEAHRKGAISNLKSSCAVLDRYIDNFYAYHIFQNFNPPSLSADYYGTLI